MTRTLTVYLALLAPLLSQATTRFVSPLGNNTPPFTNSVTAAHQISDALAIAIDGDEILVAPSVYALTQQLTLTNAVQLVADGIPGTVVISGQGSTRCLYMSNTGAVVAGFTITRGSSGDRGGGAYIDSGTISSCTIVSNSSSIGDIRAAGGIFVGSNGIVSACTIAANTAIHAGGVVIAGGGQVIDSVIERNTAASQFIDNEHAGGVWIDDGGLLARSEIRSNIAAHGAGVHCRGGGVVDNCTVHNNHATGSAGGIYCYL